jgi:hypothetical protein
MKTFKQHIRIYTTESAANSYEGVYEPINSKEAVRLHGDILRKYFSGKNKIYRGALAKNFLPDNSVYYGHGEKIQRKSAFADNNLYTILMSEILPSWRSYPKRNNSFICTNSTEKAVDYGRVFHHIPLENQKIAICAAPDLWGAFDYMRDKIDVYILNDFNHEIYKFFSVIIAKGGFSEYIKLTDEVFDSKDSTIRLFNMVENYLNTNKNAEKILKDVPSFYPKVRKILKVIADTPNFSFIDYFDDLMKPTNNDFGLKTFDEYITNHSSDSESELWFSGKCLVVESNFDTINFMRRELDLK